MTKYLIIALALLVILMLIKSFKKTKALKKDSEYVKTYINVLKKVEDADRLLNEYIATETNQTLNNKAKIVKIYQDMMNGSNPNVTINNIDFDKVFDVSKESIIENTDMFIWLILDLSKARSKSMIDVMYNLYNKVSVYENKLNDIVEYKVFKATYESLLEKGFEGIDFLKDLLAGNYSNYSYDKQLIGVYKKMAAAILVYTGEPLSEGDDALLKDFAYTQVGNRFMKDLSIIDKYLQETPKTEKE